MSLSLLYKDELRGFYKSNVMVVMWLGLPLLAMIAYVSLPPLDADSPMSVITSGIISSIGGWLAAMMLAVHIIHEKSHHVYELFLVRPVRKSHVILSKFFAVFTCVALASFISLAVMCLLNALRGPDSGTMSLHDVWKSLIVILSILSMECAAGAFVGVLVSSVLVGIILIVVTHTIASLTVIAPMMSHYQNATSIALCLAAGVSSLFLYSAVAVFNRKQV